MTEIVSKYQCQWIGHLAPMSTERIPKQLLFGKLPKTCPRHGPKRQKRDVAVMAIRTLGIDKDWFTIAQHQWFVNRFIYLTILWRCVWATDPLNNKHFLVCAFVYWNILEISKYINNIVALDIYIDHGNLEAPGFQCSCGRTFCRKGDLTRHSHFCKAS